MNKHYVRMDNGTAFLCCGKAGCPSVAKTAEGLIKITDDDGNSVQMKQEEAELIHLAVCHVNDEGTDSVETKPENFGIEVSE